MFKSSKMITKILKNFSNLVKWHLGSLLYYLDPVISSKGGRYQFSSSSSSWEFTFLLAIIAETLSILYGNVYLVYCSVGDFNSSVFKDSPLAVNHQILPRPIWPQTDVALFISYAISTAVFCTFLRRPYTAGRYQVEPSTSLVTISGEGNDEKNMNFKCFTK